MVYFNDKFRKNNPKLLNELYRSTNHTNKKRTYPYECINIDNCKQMQNISFRNITIPDQPESNNNNKNTQRCERGAPNDFSTLKSFKESNLRSDNEFDNLKNENMSERIGNEVLILLFLFISD